MGARLAYAAAIVAGVSFAAAWFVELPPAVEVAWKGAGVALLAVYAALSARSLDGWLLAAVMAFGALGDVLLETHGLIVGAVAFLAGHLTAISLYLRNRPIRLAASDGVVAAVIAVGTPLVAFLLPADRAGAPGVAVYAVGLGLMAATAWLSRFPRGIVAVGALMFVASDLLIFVRGGRPALDILPMHFAVWGLYFAGQALIAWGVVRQTTAPSGIRPAATPGLSRS